MRGVKVQKKIYLILRVAAQFSASRCNVRAASTLLLQALCTLLPQQLSQSEQAQSENSQPRQTVTSGRFKMEPALLWT